MTDPKKSGIANDGRRSYYTDAAQFVNINKHVCTSSGYSHFVPKFIPYHLVNFNSVLNYYCAAHGCHDIHLQRETLMYCTVKQLMIVWTFLFL